MTRTSTAWTTPKLPRLVGVKGACKVLGIQKMTLKRWTETGSGVPGKACFGPDRTYMIPPLRIGDGSDEDTGWPLWVREDLEWFAAKIGRKRG